MTSPPARRARLGALASLLALGCANAGCGEGARDREAADAGAAMAPRRVEGPVVARVDGVPIGLGEVRALAGRLGLAAPEALRRLEDERLLLAEAWRRGFRRAPTEAERRRGAVRALLAAVEAEETLPELDEAELRTAFAAGGEVEAPERRATEHLALLSDDAVPGLTLASRRDLAADLLRELLAGSLSWHDLIRPLEATGGAGDVRGVPAEHRALEPFTRREQTVPEPYAAVAFSGAADPGLRDAPLVHEGVVFLVRVTEREPERRRDFPTYVAYRRKQAHTMAVSGRLQGVVRDGAIGRVALADEALPRLLANDGPLAPLTAPPVVP